MADALLFFFCFPGSFVQVNSGKCVLVSFSVAYSEEQGWASRKKARLEVFPTLPVQNARVTEICSDGIARGSVHRGDGRLSHFGVTWFALGLL